jgi:hypothetical protein
VVPEIDVGSGSMIEGKATIFDGFLARNRW